MPEAYVYIHLDEGPVPAGILETAGTGREAGARSDMGGATFSAATGFRLIPFSCH